MKESEEKNPIPPIDPDKRIVYKRPEGGITRETIRKAVEYIVWDKPREDALTGNMDDVIDVYQDEEILSFKLPTSGNIHMRTGLGGFINWVESGIIPTWYVVKFNGVILDKDQTEQFWNQYETIKEKYESRE